MEGGDFDTDLGPELFGRSWEVALALVLRAGVLSVVLKRGFGLTSAFGDAVHGSVFSVLMNHFQDSGFWGTSLGVRVYDPGIEHIQAISEIRFVHSFKNFLFICHLSLNICVQAKY